MLLLGKVSWRDLSYWGLNARRRSSNLGLLCRHLHSSLQIVFVKYVKYNFYGLHDNVMREAAEKDGWKHVEKNLFSRNFEILVIVKNLHTCL